MMGEDDEGMLFVSKKQGSFTVGDNKFSFFFVFIL